MGLIGRGGPALRRRPRSLEVDPNQRKSEVRGFVLSLFMGNPQVVKFGCKRRNRKARPPRLEKPEKPRFFLSDDQQTPARREARNHRSEDAEILGPLPRGPQRTGRADQREARGDANRDRSTQNHRRRVLLSATQRPRSTNNETTTTTRHPELRDPRPDPSDDRSRELARSLFERH